MRRPLVLVEDDAIDLTTIDLSPPGASAIDIVVCSGPEGEEQCPLVVDGYCPVGTPDVVVSNLSSANPWAASIRSAWTDLGVPVVLADDEEGPLAWPGHLGAALRENFER